MALSLKASNDLKSLAEDLCQQLDNNRKNKEVFRPVYIVTQTDGMNIWLKHQIADTLDIAANYRYIKPHDLINQVYFILGGPAPEVLTSENFQWILYVLLQDKQFMMLFPDVSDYYNDGTPDNDLKRMALAGKIADLFDQYQIYRPELISKWNKHNVDEVVSDWQQYLWIKAKSLLSDKLPDKTIISAFILNALEQQEAQKRLQSKLPVVYIFGLSITTEYHTTLYHALGAVVDLQFFLLNPSPEVYWFDDKNEKHLARLRMKYKKVAVGVQVGNSLLTSWGRILQDTYGLLFKNEDFLNGYGEIGLSEPRRDTLLGIIQNDIYNSNLDKPVITAKDIADSSVTINSCYNAVREVEVLYNYLVHQTIKLAGKLSPRDIVVMVSDIEMYAPYIKAIFDNAPYKLRYSIADDKYASGNNISAALHALLSINEENFTSENVLQLLDSPFIRDRFGITDVNLIRDVVNNANIRYGLENEIHNETYYVSWTYGLQRIMYGICISGEDEYGSGQESLYPVDLVEGSASQQLIRFTHFVRLLMDNLKSRKEHRSLVEWASYIQELMDNMICDPEETTDEDYQIIQNQLESYNTIDITIDKISYQVFSNNLADTLQSQTRSTAFISGGVTFCSLIPMRSIPFKVVAMLGLNFDKFPRKENVLGFSLMGERRPGDRTTKENDKHLFLETILSAQEYLYVSYVGQSIKDNSIIPPSALVDELIDYVTAGAVDIADARSLLITRHPLHGFSQKYNQENSKASLRTYLLSGKNEQIDLISPEKEMAPLLFEAVTISAFISFFKNPFKGYYNNVLNIYYKEEEMLLEETELFELNGLQKWSLKSQFLTADASEVIGLKDAMVKTGRLPLKSMAEVSLSEIESDVTDVKELFMACIEGQPLRNEYIETDVDGTKYMGSLSIYGSKLVVVSFSKVECKYLLDAYLQYLFAKSAGLEVQLNFISSEKNQVFEAIKISKEEAESRLKNLARLYKEGHKRILAFSPHFFTDPHGVQDLDEDAFHAMLKGVINNYRFPCDDPYILSEWAKEYHREKDYLTWFKSNSELLLQPLAEIFPDYFPLKAKKATK